MANLFLRRGLSSYNLLYKSSRNSLSVVNYPDTNSLKIRGNIKPPRTQVKNIHTKTFVKSSLKLRLLPYNNFDPKTLTCTGQIHTLKFGLAAQQIFPSKYIN